MDHDELRVLPTDEAIIRFPALLYSFLAVNLTTVTVICFKHINKKIFLIHVS